MPYQDLRWLRKTARTEVVCSLDPWIFQKFSLVPDQCSKYYCQTPNSNMFSDWKRTGQVSLVKTHWFPTAKKKFLNSLGKQQLELPIPTWSSRALWNLNRGKFVSQLALSKRFLGSFFYFWARRYNRTLNDWSRGKQWVFFLSTSMFSSATLRVSGS